MITSAVVRAFRGVARFVAHGAFRVLPRPTYDRVHDLTLDAYRRLVRWRYRRGTSIAASRGGAALYELRMRRAVADAIPYSLVGPSGLEATYEAVWSSLEDSVPGAIVECGVARGGGAAVMRRATEDAGRPDVPLWLFDSFEGMPPPGKEDLDEQGRTGEHVRPLPERSCLGTVDDVRSTLANLTKSGDSDVKYIKGWFEQTAPNYSKVVGPIAVLRLDGDWYDSTQICMESFFPSISPKGYLVIDDFDSCVGSRRAVVEYFQTHSISLGDLRSDGSGGRVYRRPPLVGG